MEYTEITKENISDEHICCIIRAKSHPGIDAKKQWLSERLNEGHVFRKLNAKECAFIEYAPLETAWVPIVGDNFLYIYCLWVQGTPKGNGYGRSLMEHCIKSAKEQGKSGVCMLGAAKQKNWLSDQNFAKKFGFKTVSETKDGYELLSLSFDGINPEFSPTVTQKIPEKNLVIFYDYQCPFIFQRIEKLQKHCYDNNIPADFRLVNSIEKAKNLPCVFNNWGAFYNGKFISVNQLDGAAVQKIIKKSK